MHRGRTVHTRTPSLFVILVVVAVAVARTVILSSIDNSLFSSEAFGQLSLPTFTSSSVVWHQRKDIPESSKTRKGFVTMWSTVARHNNNKKNSKNKNNSHDTQGNGTVPAAAAPMYITIGPQCCGKSTILKELNENLVDISLDDQPDVYVPISTTAWLDALKASEVVSTSSTETETETTQVSSTSTMPKVLEETIYHEKSLWKRISEGNTELNLVLLRWNGHIDSNAFRQRMLKYYQDEHSRHYDNNNNNNNNGGTNATSSPSTVEMLIAAVEDLLPPSPVTSGGNEEGVAEKTVEEEEEGVGTETEEETTPSSPTAKPSDEPSTAADPSSKPYLSLPEMTQLFIVESLFRPNPQTNQSAIQRGHTLLQTTPKAVPVSWGNTNSKARDYQQALDIAHQTNRPVYFVLCHPELQQQEGRKQQAANETVSASATTPSLPWLPLDTLLRRNLQRLSATGKYVPAFAIEDCRQRIASMVATPSSNNASSSSSNGPSTNATTIVVQNFNNQLDIDKALVALASPSSFQYVLTSNRFIKKQYPSQRQRNGNGGGRNNYHSNNNNKNYNTSYRDSYNKNNYNNSTYNSRGGRGGGRNYNGNNTNNYNANDRHYNTTGRYQGRDGQRTYNGGRGRGSSGGGRNWNSGTSYSNTAKRQWDGPSSSSSSRGTHQQQGHQQHRGQYRTQQQQQQQYRPYRSNDNGSPPNQQPSKTHKTNH